MKLQRFEALRDENKLMLKYGKSLITNFVKNGLGPFVVNANGLFSLSKVLSFFKFSFRTPSKTH